MNSDNTPSIAPGCVIRSFALPVDVFDHIKATQRHIQEAEGLHLNNSRVVARLLREHKAMAAPAAD